MDLSSSALIGATSSPRRSSLEAEKSILPILESEAEEEVCFTTDSQELELRIQAVTQAEQGELLTPDAAASDTGSALFALDTLEAVKEEGSEQPSVEESQTPVEATPESHTVAAPLTLPPYTATENNLPSAPTAPAAPSAVDTGYQPAAPSVRLPSAIRTGRRLSMDYVRPHPHNGGMMMQVRPHQGRRLSMDRVQRRLSTGYTNTAIVNQYQQQQRSQPPMTVMTNQMPHESEHNTMYSQSRRGSLDMSSLVMPPQAQQVYQQQQQQQQQSLAAAAGRPALPRLGSIRKPNFKRESSWFCLGYDSTSSSQHYRNMMLQRTDSFLSFGQDSWAAMTIPSVYNNSMKDDAFDSSFATNTTGRMSSALYDDDLLSLEGEGKDNGNGSNDDNDDDVSQEEDILLFTNMPTNTNATSTTAQASPMVHVDASLLGYEQAAPQPTTAVSSAARPDAILV